jgi:hypothetical protein
MAAPTIVFSSSEHACILERSCRQTRAVFNTTKFARSKRRRPFQTSRSQHQNGVSLLPAAEVFMSNYLSQREHLHATYPRKCEGCQLGHGSIHQPPPPLHFIYHVEC